MRWALRELPLAGDLIQEAQLGSLRFATVVQWCVHLGVGPALVWALGCIHGM
jgi:hypothetical protein